MDETILGVLKTGEIKLKGEFVWGSNYTFLVDITQEDQKLTGVYKPIRGEQPLWDFPPASLAHRETAAYMISQALGWRLVPPTVYRRLAPLGSGSVQLFINHDPEYHYFTFSEVDRQRLRPTAVFDLLLNNADRKGSHVLFDSEDHIWLIDHGLCFHAEEKLRTVIWDFVDEPIPGDLMEGISSLINQLDTPAGTNASLRHSLQRHISSSELVALRQRAMVLLEMGKFPIPNPERRNYPWPQL